MKKLAIALGIVAAAGLGFKFKDSIGTFGARLRKTA